MSGFEQAEMVRDLALADNLEGEFQNLASLKQQMLSDLSIIDEQIANLQELRASAAEPYNTAIKEAEARIKAEIVSRGTSFKCPHGKATFRKEYERASWDDKALQGYAATHDELLQFRKVTVVQASVSIQVGE